MGKLVKSHLARLLVLVAAAYQFAAAVHGFFWRKLFWDFLTKKLDGLVDPPILQVINLVCGLIVLAWEWPIGVVAGMRLHQSIKLRLFTLLFPLLAAILLYQATNSALYYIIGIGVYYLAYKDGERWWLLSRGPCLDRRKDWEKFALSRDNTKTNARYECALAGADIGIDKCFEANVR